MNATINAMHCNGVKLQVDTTQKAIYELEINLKPRSIFFIIQIFEKKEFIILVQHKVLKKDLYEELSACFHLATAFLKVKNFKFLSIKLS